MNINKLSILSFLVISFIYSQCEYDYTNYGSANCDTAWDEYGLSCATLASNYGWDCSGCSCPGDNNEGNGDLCWEENELTGQGEWVNCDDGWDIDIPGCTDENASNYNPEAGVDDGSCYYGNDGTPCIETQCWSYIQEDWSCDELIEYGIDCSACEEECGHDEGGGQESGLSYLQNPINQPPSKECHVNS